MTPLTDPRFLPYKLDLVARRALVLRMDAAQRNEAAFLDERALKPDTEGGWMPLDMFLDAGLLDTELVDVAPADAIFHIGHCGSTLLSRVLAAWPGVQALREPLPLRNLAEAWPRLAEVDSRLSPQEAHALLRQLWRAWSRPLAGQQRTVVKATSSCNGLIAPLLESQPAMLAVLLDMPLRPYLATLLKSPDSVRDAAMAAAERLRDLHARGFGGGAALHVLSLPQQCAMGWLAERVRFAALEQAYPGRVLRVDFENLLAQPAEELRRIAQHLQLDPVHVPVALQSPAWTRYSKAQDHGYGRQDRAHDLILAQERYAADIAAGEAWCRALIQRHPQLAPVAA